MNISVPDALGEEVRRRDLPISAICQRALRDEVEARRALDLAGNILVYVASEQEDPDPLTWPGFDPAAPTLTYQRWHAGGRWQLGWVLGYADHGGPSDYFIPGDQDSPPLAEARKHLERVSAADGGAERITVQVGDPALTVGFTGSWLVEPDSDETRTGEEGHDAGAYWGVALTGRGRIAVQVAHCNERWPASLDDYGTLGEAIADGLPEDIAARAATAMGEEHIIWRDI